MHFGLYTVDEAGLTGCEPRQVLCYMFLFSQSLSLLFVGLDRAQNTKGTELHMNNQPVETFGLTRKIKQCARSRFVQHKTKQLCSLLLKFVELPNQLVLSTLFETI